MIFANTAGYSASGILRQFGGRGSVIVLLITFFVITVPQFYWSVQASNGLQSTWFYAPVWIESSDCARTTGVILVLCRDGKLIPISDETSGDDLGHALSLDLFSMATQKQIALTDISILNTTVNYIGLIVLSLLLLFLRLPFVAFLTLAFGPGISDQFHRLTPHPSQFGTACFAAILPLAILGFAKAKSDCRSVWLWFVIGFLSLAIAAMFRQAIGLMGVVAGLIAVILSFAAQPRNDKRPLRHLAMVIGILAISQTPTILLRARDAIYNIPPTRMMEQHGIWHNLYIGLGAVDNPFGIEWLDASGLRAAKRINPSVEFLTAEYYATLRSEYFRILKQHPFEVSEIYHKKFIITLSTRLHLLFLSIDVKTAILFICAFAAFVYWRLRWAWRPSDAAFAVSSIFVCFFIGQATVFHFDIQYLFPIQIFLLICFGSLIDAIVLSRVGEVPIVGEYRP